MSVQARFAVAFSEVSGTVMPVTIASVNVEFTSGCLKRVRSANGTLKCTWFVFRVRHVNQMLSVSVIVRPSLLWKTSPTSKSSKKRPRQTFGAAWASTLIPSRSFQLVTLCYPVERARSARARVTTGRSISSPSSATAPRPSRVPAS